MYALTTNDGELRMSFTSLLLRVFDDVLVLLLAPDLVIVLDTAWFVDLRLLCGHVNEYDYHGEYINIPSSAVP